MARVLIVDDSEANLQLMRIELQRCGYEVSTVRSGVEALKSIPKIRPDLVLLDVLMPDMDGFETCRRIKTDPESCQIPVLIWTSLDDTEDVVRGLEVGAQDYVTKPFVAEVLRARIRTALREKQSRDQLVAANDCLEESQRATERALSVRNEFLSHVSHELRTPLTTVHQFLSILMDGLAGELNVEQQEYLGICMRSAKQLRSMISDLMDVTRVQNGKLRVAPVPLELAPLLQEVVTGLESSAAARGVALAAHAERLPEVLGDQVRIRQVLTNLIDNAVKFTPEGGEVSLLASRDVEDPSFVRLEVRDTGCGVSREAQNEIFQYMQQAGDNDWRSRNGLGIGLYICRELVTRQGGRIWVESEGGKGSSFFFTLPVFDFLKLLEPAILADGVLRDVVSLVRVDLLAGGDSSRGVSEALIRRASHVVQTSLYPGDVLLPRGFGSGERESLFIVAGTDEAGMASLSSRIRDRLAREVSSEGVTIEVRGRVEPQSEEDRRLAPEAGAKVVAQEIHLLTRADSNWSE